MCLGCRFSRLLSQSSHPPFEPTLSPRRRRRRLFLDGTTVKPLEVKKDEGVAILEGTTVSLTKAAADALNGVFGVKALTEFFPVGIAEITLELPKSGDETTTWLDKTTNATADSPSGPLGWR